MKPRPTLCLTFPLISALLGLATHHAGAALYSWTPATGGSLNDSLNWNPIAAPSPSVLFTNADTAQLAQDFLAAPAFTLDGNITINILTYDDTGAAPDAGATIASGNTLTLAGISPAITVTPALANPGVTISAKLAGSAGLLKNGQGGLTLSGDNTGLTGTLTIENPGATNNGGIYLATLESLGGITNVTTLGTVSTGGFFRIVGSAITIPNTVTFDLSGQGGNSAPNGTLVSAGTGIHTVKGTINFNTSGVRISNASATRFDLEGPILGGANSILFRLAANEGVHLINPANDWTGTTTHGGGILWYEPGALPTSISLVLAGSDPGTVQTKGTFSRALGTAAGEVSWANGNQTTAMREGGFSARGGDLTVNLGGAAADAVFFTAFPVTGTRTVGSPSITAVNTTNLAVGMNITGAGLPNGATISAIPTPGTSGTITISGNATTAVTAGALTSTQTNPARINTSSLWLNNVTADSKLTFVNPLDLNGANRNVRVDANTAELAGFVKNTGATAATLGKSGAGTLVVPGASGAVGLSVSGGILELAASAVNYTQTGATTISNGGTVLLKTAAALGSANINLTKTGVSLGTLRVDLTGTNTFLNPFGAFGSSNGLANGGTPNLINLQGNNTFAGNITITGAGGNGANFTSDGGTLTLSGNFTNNITNSNRTLSLGGTGSGTLSGNAANGSATAAQSNIVKSGSGTWNLTSPASSFTGGLNLLDGIVNAAVLADIGTNSSIGSDGAITFGGQGTSGTLQYTGSTAQSTNRPIVITPSGGTLDSSGTAPVAFTGTFTTTETAAQSTNYTSGSTTAINTVAAVPAVMVGMTLTGVSGIPDGTTITAITGNSYTLSNAFTGTTGSVVTGFLPTDRSLVLTGSNTGANNISSVLAESIGGGRLSLVKTGLGAWTLNGANTFSGNTTVSAGTLTLGTANPGNEASTVTIAGTGATLNLAYTGTDSVDKLFIGTTQQAAGVYGKTGSALPVIGLAQITGDGTLTVARSPGAGTSFSTWITGTFANGTVPADQRGPNGDFDKDGIPNLLEFAVDGQDPTVANAAIGTLAGTTLSYAKRPGTTGLSYAIEGSTDLGTPTAWVVVTGAGYVNNPSSISLVLSPPIPARNFVRLKVTQTP